MTDSAYQAIRCGKHHDAAQRVMAPYRRIFCTSATGANYALLSPFVRYFGYGAPQPRASMLGEQGREGPSSTSYQHPLLTIYDIPHRVN
jgi:hypothetical protein